MLSVKQKLFEVPAGNKVAVLYKHNSEKENYFSNLLLFFFIYIHYLISKPSFLKKITSQITLSCTNFKSLNIIVKVT